MSRDHIIPRFILKGFAINPEANPKKQKIMIYDRKTSTVETKKIVDAYAIEDFNSSGTEQFLAYKYENDVAKIFQRIKMSAENNDSSVELSNTEYSLLFRFFTIMWRRNDIQIDKAKEMLKGIDNFMQSIFGNELSDRLKPEYKDKNLEDIFEESKTNWVKPFYEYVIKTTSDKDPTVLKTIKNYVPTIIYNKSNIHFILHDTYGTLRYIIEKNREIGELDVPYLMIEPISAKLCFCLMFSKNEIDISQQKYNIKIETWDNNEDIKQHFIDGYITPVAKSFVVDETNQKFIRNS